MKAYKLGNAIGLDFIVEPGWFWGSLVLFTAAGMIGIALLSLAWGEVVVFGLICVVLHWLADMLHQLGHARAARQTGHSMIGIRFGTVGLLSTALYPANEPPLPASIHIHRALGGPRLSAGSSVIAVALVVALWDTNAILRWGSLFFLLDNFLVLTVGAFLPLGFTDGSTILHWRGKA